jgi:sec-independent protein translocase protein TatA
MPDLGWQELAIIMVIVIIIFGAGRLPEIGGALGKSIKEFRANTEGVIGDSKSTASKPLATSETTAATNGAKVPVSKEVRADEI